MSGSKIPIRGLAKLRRHIFICVSDKEKCAKRSLQDESWAYLKRRVRELSLGQCVGRTRANCFQHTCTIRGPVACVFCNSGAT